MPVCPLSERRALCFRPEEGPGSCQRDSVHVVLLPAAQTAPDGRDPNTLTGQVGPVLHVGVPTSSGLRVVTWLGAPWLRPGTEWSPRWGLRAQPGPWPSP